MNNKTKKLSRFVSAGLFLAIVFVSFTNTNKASAFISNPLSYGARSSAVSVLQTFLSTNPLIYPAGLVTGYFGALTRGAVVQFQAAYDIPQVGHVGPMTAAKMNAVQASANGLDISAPVLSNTTVQVTSTSATINWTTSELAKSQVYYSTSPIAIQEAGAYNQKPYISGLFSPENASVSTTNAISISGLQSNTLYYYSVVSTDNADNVSMSWPETFRTN